MISGSSSKEVNSFKRPKVHAKSNNLSREILPVDSKRFKEARGVTDIYQINNTIPAILGGDFGDSPFRRLGSLQQNLENPLAQEILAAKFITGNTINVDWRDQVMTFSKT
jgi:hypothetical protein